MIRTKTKNNYLKIIEVYEYYIRREQVDPVKVEGLMSDWDAVMVFGSASSSRCSLYESFRLAGVAVVFSADTAVVAAVDGDDFSAAMLPGVSRSGATIMGGLMMGVERKTAAEFSFFLAVPTMLAATVYALWKDRALLNADDLGMIAIGFTMAFLVAVVVVKAFVAIVGSGNVVILVF